MAATAPVTRLPKKLIVCCDGTWMNSDIGWSKDGFFDAGHPQNPSNVTRIARALVPQDKKQHVQIVYYQSGIGTSWSSADKFLGGGLALGLSENIREAYGFLVNNYMEVEGSSQYSDKLYFIGFSRGAYTARSVAGMIGTLGLLKKSAMSYFYAVFDDFENAGSKTYTPKLPQHHSEFRLKESPSNLNKYLTAYKEELIRCKMTREVDIEAIGVFDTVGSLGVPVVPWLQKLGLPTTLHTYRFFDTGIGKYVKNAFQVLALDEHRSAFGPTVWSKDANNKDTKLKQIWMPGVHTNAGGGADDNAMSDISLAWMMDQLNTIEGTPLEFDKNYLRQQAELTQRDYQDNLRTEWKWGLGKLGNSMKFPTSLAGSITRTPFNYFITDYESGKSTGEKLKNTGELIHASVRTRWKRGETYDGRKYTSNALKGWEVQKDRKTGAPFVWQSGDQFLTEDEMGDFEKQLLGFDHEAKRFVETGE